MLFQVFTEDGFSGPEGGHGRTRPGIPWIYGPDDGAHTGHVGTCHTKPNGESRAKLATKLGIKLVFKLG